MKNKDLRRLRCLVKAQTLWHLELLAYLDGCGDVGRMVDKLTRDKVLALRQSAVGPWAGHAGNPVKRLPLIESSCPGHEGPLGGHGLPKGPWKMD